MKNILYIILSACVGVFGYKCSSTCQDLFRDIVEQEVNRGITVASPQGARVAVYREGKQGAPNEEIVLSNGGNISWCGMTIQECKGSLVVSYRQQTEVINPENMKKVDEEGIERKIWNAVVLDEDAHYIRLSYGVCTEPPCAAASPGGIPAKNDPDYGRLYSENHICMVQCELQGHIEGICFT